MSEIELPPFEERRAARLRAEAHGMARAYVHALLVELPRESIVGIYGKGSAYRPWDSVIDYVPELSDVDVHVRLEEEGAERARTLVAATAIAHRALSQFDVLFPGAEHRPRPQLVLLDEIESKADYVGSPRGQMHTLFGAAPDEIPPTDFPETSALDARRFRADADFVEHELSRKVVDRPGPLLWHAVGLVTWRVGPAAPRVLTQVGTDPVAAWSMNRTSLVRTLRARGLWRIARAYVDFYLAGWDGFRCGFADGEPAVRALRAASGVFEAGREIVEGRAGEIPDDGGAS